MPKRTAKPAGDKRVKVTLVKSTIGFGRKQAAVVEGLGLRRMRHTIEMPIRPRRAA